MIYLKTLTLLGFAFVLLSLTGCDALKEAGGDYLKGQQANAESNNWSKLAEQRVPDYENALARWEADDDPISALNTCQSGSIVLNYYQQAKNQAKISEWEEKIAEPCRIGRGFQERMNRR